MTLAALTALSAYAFITSITPGPNNLMLMASGANFGLRRSLPHMLGVGIGFMVMLFSIGLGIGQLFDAIPASHRILQAFSIAYLLYLALKIARSAPPSDPSQPAQEAFAPGTNTDSDAMEAGRTEPLSFLQAASFQWINPKGWVMALTAISLYAPQRDLQTLLILTLVFGAINVPSVGVWTLVGTQLRRLLTNPRRLALFNGIMAVALIGTLYPILFVQF